MDPLDFYTSMHSQDVQFFAGVPDSILKEFSLVLEANCPPQRHIVAFNEGGAIGLAIGNHLATGRVPLVYMQNSGIGNAWNPLVSLAHPTVYRIPMVLVIGWRAEMDAHGCAIADEPQHMAQGHATLEQLSLLSIPWQVVDRSSDAAQLARWAVETARTEQKPVALVIRKNTFSPAGISFARRTEGLVREIVIENIFNTLPKSTVFVGTTGMTSREMDSVRSRRGQAGERDFLVVGGMGHASSIACGLAHDAQDRLVACIDGDGASLMHLGALVHGARLPNLLHVVINNGGHESVGGQPTSAAGLALAPVARACGYGMVLSAATESELSAGLLEAAQARRSVFIEVTCRQGHRPDLGRPQRTPSDSKSLFMAQLHTS